MFLSTRIPNFLISKWLYKKVMVIKMLWFYHEQKKYFGHGSLDNLYQFEQKRKIILWGYKNLYIDKSVTKTFFQKIRESKSGLSYCFTLPTLHEPHTKACTN